MVDANGVLDLNSPDICKREFYHSKNIACNMKKIWMLLFMKYYNSSECDCDPNGTTDGGVCDSYTDPDEEPPLVAGQCHCKEFVEVPRCDKCINGYWNFSAENPEGCIGW